jgi:hypothetical protein
MQTQPECVTAGGGSTTVVNQDEALIISRGVSEIPTVTAPGGADDFSHVSPSFREQAL